jgi:hypothetical protein
MIETREPHLNWAGPTMAIQGPNVAFSVEDKRLIRLLEKLLLESCRVPGNNSPSGSTTLSDTEALELVARIDAALESKEFWQTAQLIEMIGRGDREGAREVYLSARARHGFSRVMSSSHYHSFLVRLGFERSYLPTVGEMDYEHFVRMERRLWLQLGVQQEVVNLLERFLWSHTSEVEASRRGKHPIEDGRLIKALRAVRPKVDLRGNSAEGPWTTNRIAGALTLFSNMTVMFTTRDWSVTGTMSALCGSIGLIAAG